MSCYCFVGVQKREGNDAKMSSDRDTKANSAFNEDQLASIDNFVYWLEAHGFFKDAAVVIAEKFVGRQIRDPCALKEEIQEEPTLYEELEIPPQDSKRISKAVKALTVSVDEKFHDKKRCGFIHYEYDVVSQLIMICMNSQMIPIIM